MVDVSSVVTVISGAGAAVGGIGMARVGVKVLIQSFKYYRDVLGYSVPAAMRQARKDHDGGVTSHGRQLEKDYEQMWSHQSRR